MTNPHQPNKEEKKLIGYNCKVCKGKKITETENAIIHNFCDGILEPVYEDASPKPSNGWEKELPSKEDKIQQVFKFLEIADISEWSGKNVFEAGDADTLHDILMTALTQVETETLLSEQSRIKEKVEGLRNGHKCSVHSHESVRCKICMSALQERLLLDQVLEIINNKQG